LINFICQAQTQCKAYKYSATGTGQRKLLLHLSQKKSYLTYF